MVLQQVLVSWGIFMYGICVGCGVQFCQFERVCCICRDSKLFVIVKVCIVGKLSTFVTVVWKPGKIIFCNKFVGVV